MAGQMVEQVAPDVAGHGDEGAVCGVATDAPG